MSAKPAVVTPVEVIPRRLCAWRDRGVALISKARNLQGSLEAIQWNIGDWLVEGEKRFKQLAYKDAQEITGWKVETLRNLVWVVRRFPDASLRSDTTLRWSHFKEIRWIPDDAKREEFLSRVNEGFPRTVREVRTMNERAKQNG